MTMIFTLIGKIVVGVAVLIYAGVGALAAREKVAAYHWEHRAPEPVRLNFTDGSTVLLDPETKFPEGIRPNVLTYDGRKFERCWTNPPTADADERLWFEVSQ